MGVRFHARAVVLAAGTFLGGRIHVGLRQQAGGRAGDPPSVALAQRLHELPLQVNRLKTGTPPRIDGKTVDFSVMEAQPGDTPTPSLSHFSDLSRRPRQVCCYMTYTNERTHEIIRGGLDRSPMYTGVIEGIGPRYCPSIEDKIHRFADKNRHQVFVEPEGLSTCELYPNGISTSLPFDVQLELVRSITGFEHAHITRPGYAIEYDFFDPRDLKYSLESKHLRGLFFAGQINGTTGYEEAAAQGLLAGLNAARLAQDQEAWYPRRDQAYLGVMIDDLIRLGTSEPYRMFTSRAEYRLLLREDNADLRLTEIGHQLGMVGSTQWTAFIAKREAIERETQRLKTTWVRPDTAWGEQVNEWIEKPITHEYNLLELLKRPEIEHHQLASLTGEVVPVDVAEQVQIAAKYAGYIARQQEDIDRLLRAEQTPLPFGMSFENVSGLSIEIRQKLTRHRPETLGQAARIPGVTPAAISLLMIHLKKQGISQQAPA
jgi:tRNA uridine 5-carboxymethylaminomethyl modification enzyme